MKIEKKSVVGQKDMDEIAQAVVAGLNKAVLKEAAEEKKALKDSTTENGVQKKTK